MQPQDMTFPDFLAYCKEHGRAIYVRAKVNGKWGTHPFGQVTPESQRELAESWYKNNNTPIRLKEV